MRSPYLMLVIMIFLPTQVWSALDLEGIKKSLTENEPSFQISHWQKSEQHQGWVGQTKINRTTIIVGEKKSSFITPYISRNQKKLAKILCADFASITLGIQDKEQKDSIRDAIKKATTRHKIKYIIFDNVKFTVLPKLIGPIVSLHCSVKSR